MIEDTHISTNDTTGHEETFMGNIHASPSHKEPLIIIAAARSGTKMLRTVLASSQEFADFPYDINFIWKYGNYDIPHDQLTSANLTPRITQFINNKFRNLMKKNNNKRVLEKSVSNSLRVSFVKAVFPKCKMIHLIRDGRDVSVDAKECWQDSMFSNRIQKKSDLFRKILFFPLAAAFPYLLTYVGVFLKRLISNKKHVESWGPRFNGIDNAVGNHSLLEVCGIQWAKSVEQSLADLAKFENDVDYITIRYEDLVRNPLAELQRIADFAHIENFHRIRSFAEKTISQKYVGIWKRSLSSKEIELLSPHIDNCLKQLSYLE